MNTGAGQLPLAIRLADTATFGNFNSANNQAAVDMLRSLALQAGERALFLWGAAGSGKSHLLQAACQAASGSGRRAIYLPMAQTVLLDPEVTENLESCALVCIDDVQRTAGIEPWQHALFVLFNAVAERGGTVVATARTAPAAIPRLLPDLSSRLAWGPVYQLSVLDDTHKIAVLKARALRRGFELPDETAQFLLNRLKRDMHTLCMTLDQLDKASLVAQRRLTLPFVRSLLDKT